MKRIFCLLCAAALCLGLCACGEKTQKIDMYELEKSMISADKTLPEMKVTGSWEENAEKAFSYMSDLEYNKVSGYFLAYSADGSARTNPMLLLWSRACASTLTAASGPIRPTAPARSSVHKAPSSRPWETA